VITAGFPSRNREQAMRVFLDIDIGDAAAHRKAVEQHARFREFCRVVGSQVLARAANPFRAACLIFLMPLSR
jgi:hypothetical protein